MYKELWALNTCYITYMSLFEVKSIQVVFLPDLWLSQLCPDYSFVRQDAE